MVARSANISISRQMRSTVADSVSAWPLPGRYKLAYYTFNIINGTFERHRGFAAGLTLPYEQASCEDLPDAGLSLSARNAPNKLIAGEAQLRSSLALSAGTYHRASVKQNMSERQVSISCPAGHFMFNGISRDDLTSSPLLTTVNMAETETSRSTTQKTRPEPGFQQPVRLGVGDTFASSFVQIACKAIAVS